MADISEINPLDLRRVPDPPERRQFHLKRDTVRKPPPASGEESDNLEEAEDEPKRQIDVTA